MRILIVSTYPPMACGIGKYAAQQARALNVEGHQVDVLAPREGDGDLQDDLHGGWHPLRLLKYAWAYDLVYLHFTPYFFYDSGDRRDRIRTSLAFVLVMLLMGGRFAMMIHETSYKLGQKARGPLRHRIDRWYWRLAGQVIFHSVRERDAFAAFYRLRPQRKAFEIWPHEKYMRPCTTLDRAGARGALGLRPDRTLLLCIGFIQPHKGFDRVIEALRRVPTERLALKIVGSVRIDWDQAHLYAQRLRDLAEADPRCEVLEGYLSDELFDTWLVAANYVVVPYREIWSSSVAARCKLFNRPLLAADTGGLAEQLTPGSILFKDDEELVAALKRIAAEADSSNGLHPAQSLQPPIHAPQRDSIG